MVQPRSGYRFAVDAILLARFALPRAGDRVLELGAGCGVVAVMLAALHRLGEVVAIEIQPELAALAVRNAALNGINRLTVVCADLRQPRLAAVSPAAFDYVVANPPYRAARSGRESPNPARRIARGGDGAGMRDFLAAAARYAANGAKVAVVYTAARSAELIAEMKLRGLEPKRIRFVHPMPGKAASLVLLEASKRGGVQATVEAPLWLYRRPGVYSDEACAQLGRAK